MTTCPSCNYEKRADADFVALSHMLENHEVDVVRCVNCGEYFDRCAGSIIDKSSVSLSPAEAFIESALWTDLLSLPPDLLRIVANECGLGNRVCGSIRGTTKHGWQAFYMDGSFRDGHMVSSWIKHRSHFVDGIDLSSYICEAMCVAVCSHKSQAQEVVS